MIANFSVRAMSDISVVFDMDDILIFWMAISRIIRVKTLNRGHAHPMDEVAFKTIQAQKVKHGASLTGACEAGRT